MDDVGLAGLAHLAIVALGREDVRFLDHAQALGGHRLTGAVKQVLDSGGQSIGHLGKQFYHFMVGLALYESAVTIAKVWLRAKRLAGTRIVSYIDAFR